MSNFGPTEPFDNRQQEQDEHEQWLDEIEKQKVDNLDFHMKKLKEQFDRILERAYFQQREVTDEDERKDR